MQLRERRYGDLACRVVEAGDAGTTSDPEWVIVLMHGFGAPGHDLVPIGGELLERSDALAEGVRFVFPEAPLDLSMAGMPGARAWWWIDVERFFSATRSREILDPRTRAEPPAGMSEAREAALSMLDAVRSETGLPDERIVLGGFSQGSMLACDLALRADDPPGALVLWSSMPICVPEWTELAPRRSGLRVFQSHGRHDDVIAYALGEQLRELLTEAGLPVEFVPFDGPHGIAMSVYERFLPWIEAVVAGGEPARR